MQIGGFDITCSVTKASQQFYTDVNHISSDNLSIYKFKGGHLPNGHKAYGLLSTANCDCRVQLCIFLQLTHNTLERYLKDGERDIFNRHFS